MVKRKELLEDEYEGYLEKSGVTNMKLNMKLSLYIENNYFGERC